MWATRYSSQNVGHKVGHKVLQEVGHSHCLISPPPPPLLFLQTQKRDSFRSTWEPCLDLLSILSGLRKELEEGKMTEERMREGFHLLLRCSLWGNKCDISITGGE